MHLKEKQVVARDSFSPGSIQMHILEARVKCSASEQSSIDHWSGLFYDTRGRIEAEPFEISERNLLLKGSFLRSPSVAVGAVLHVGSDSLSTINLGQLMERPSVLLQKRFKLTNYICLAAIIISFTLAIGNEAFLAN